MPTEMYTRDNLETARSEKIYTLRERKRADSATHSKTVELFGSFFCAFLGNIQQKCIYKRHAFLTKTLSRKVMLSYESARKKKS